MEGSDYIKNTKSKYQLSDEEKSALEIAEQSKRFITKQKYNFK